MRSLKNESEIPSSIYKDHEETKLCKQIKEALGYGEDDQMPFKIPRMKLEKMQLVDKFDAYGCTYYNNPMTFRFALKEHPYAP